MRSTTGRMSDVATPPGHTPIPRPFDSPRVRQMQHLLVRVFSLVTMCVCLQVSLSIMDETGLTKELFLAPTPTADRTYMVRSVVCG